jgi:Raf kinase inhibitor-like YbhB/YbcL family protein
MRRVGFSLLSVCLAVMTASCSTNDGRTMKAPGANQGESIAIVTTTSSPGADGNGSVMTVTAPWQAGAAIDPRYTCDGDNVSPAVSWADGPANASAYAVILTDLDAPDFAHWTVANIDASATGLAEGDVSDLAAVAMNSDAKPAYTGPCPPAGSTHHYSLTVYALSQVLESQSGDPAPAMRAAIEGAAIESATSEFTFSR